MVFSKWRCLDKDFIITVLEDPVADLSPVAQSVCSHKYGLGADAFIALGNTDMGMYTVDVVSAEGENLGRNSNALRCAGAHLIASGLLSGSSVSLVVGGEPVTAELLGNRWVKLNMGQAVSSEKTCLPEYPDTMEIILNHKHLIIFVKNINHIRAEVVPGEERGYALTVAEIISPRLIRVFMSPSGKSVPDSGYSSSAAAMAGIKKGYLENNVSVSFTDGELQVEYQPESGMIYSTAASSEICRGMFNNFVLKH